MVVFEIIRVRRISRQAFTVPAVNSITALCRKLFPETNTTLMILRRKNIFFYTACEGKMHKKPTAKPSTVTVSHSFIAGEFVFDIVLMVINYKLYLQ